MPEIVLFAEDFFWHFVFGAIKLCQVEFLDFNSAPKLEIQ